MISGVAAGVICLALTTMGFGPAGIAAGSAAAAIHANIGSVAAGSLFAVLQGAGATGALVTGLATGFGAAGAGMATLLALHWSTLRRKMAAMWQMVAGRNGAIANNGSGGNILRP